MLRSQACLAVVWLTTLVGAMALLDGEIARAQEFRIVSQVFAGDPNVPANTITTIFSSGIVYDFLDDSSQTTIFDPARKRFILLDASRKWRCEILTDRVTTFSNQLQANAAARQESLYRFMAHPHFERSVDKATGELLLKSPQLNYRLKTEPVIKDAKGDEILRRYIEFSDSYARLNTMLNIKMGAMPPFPRIAVNHTLRQMREMPTQVKLTITNRDPKGNEQVLALESRHEIQWKLGGDDHRKIEESKKQLAAFKPVELELFQKSSEEMQASREDEKPNRTR